MRSRLIPTRKVSPLVNETFVIDLGPDDDQVDGASGDFCKIDTLRLAMELSCAVYRWEASDRSGGGAGRPKETQISRDQLYLYPGVAE